MDQQTVEECIKIISELKQEYRAAAEMRNLNNDNQCKALAIAEARILAQFLKG